MNERNGKGMLRPAMLSKVVAALVVALGAACQTETMRTSDAADYDAGTSPDAAYVDAAETSDAAHPDADVDASMGNSADACALAADDPNNRRAVSACRAIDAFARGDFVDPFELLLADAVARRFGVAALSGAWSSYLEALALSPNVGIRAYGRVGDAAVQVTTDELGMFAGIDGYTAPALYCREHALPADYDSRLADGLALGGYHATHVLLALLWLGDGACPLPGGDVFLEATIAATASLIDQNHLVTSDLEVEAAAFLAYLDATHRIPAGFTDGLLATQQAGGGWSVDSTTDPASGHTTGLALWYLHEELFPGRTTPMVTTNARTTTADAGP